MNYFVKKYAALSDSNIKIILGTILLFICAQASIPLKPVPITLHTVGVIAIALCCSKRESVYTMISYASLRAIGLPVFADYRSGLSVICGSSGGYIVGFIFAAYVIGSLKEKYGDNSLLKLLAYSVAGTIMIYACGISWLSYFIGIKQAVKLGLLPFILSGFLKALFTGLIVRAIKTRISVS